MTLGSNSFLILKGNSLSRRACIYRRVRGELIEISQRAKPDVDETIRAMSAPLKWGFGFLSAGPSDRCHFGYIERALPAGFMGAIETCKRAFAIPRKKDMCGSAVLSDGMD